MSETHDPYAALRLRDYRCFLAGGMLASVGLGAQTVAVGWELSGRAATKYEAAMLLGLTGLVQFLPVLLLALPAGQTADLFNRKHLYQLTQTGLALLSLTLTALSVGDGPIPLFLLTLLLIGVCRAFSTPARVALLPQILPLSLLPNAVTWNSTGWQVANVVGPALGGLAIALAGPAAAYTLAASCALGCVLMLTPVRPRAAVSAGGPRSLATLLAGVAFVGRSPLLLSALTLDLFAVLLGGATALLPLFAREILHVNAVGLGWLRAAPSLGAVLVAVMLAHRPPLRRAGWTLLGSVAGFGLATIVFGLSESFWLSFAALAAVGACDNVSVVVRGTLMQTLTPDEMRGRVAAVNYLFISSSNELGEFESGVTAAWLGEVPAVVAGGVGTLLVVLAVAVACPPLRRLGPLHSARETVVEKTDAAVP